MNFPAVPTSMSAPISKVRRTQVIQGESPAGSAMWGPSVWSPSVWSPSVWSLCLSWAAAAAVLCVDVIVADEVPPEPKARSVAEISVESAAAGSLAPSSLSEAPAQAVSDTTIPLESPPVAAAAALAEATQAEEPVAPVPSAALEALTEDPLPLRSAEGHKSSASSAAGIGDRPGSLIADRVRSIGVPAWVESLPNRAGAVHTTAVSSGPFFKRRDCELALDSKLKEKTDEYINEYLGHSRAALFPSLNYNSDYVRMRLLRPENIHYEEITGTSYGDMQQAHALLEFDNAFRQELDRSWAHLVKTSHLLKTGFGAAGVVAMLSVLFGYFRTDTATRGYYSRRLQFLAVTAILGLVATGVFLVKWLPAANWIPWI